MRQFQYAFYASLFIFTITLAATAQRFAVTTIPMPPKAINIGGIGISQLGVIVGEVSFTTEGCPFIYDQIHSPQVICSLVNGQSGSAFGINDFNQIAGASDGHGFIYSNGTISEAGLLPNGTFSLLLSINNDAQATGWADTGGGPLSYHGILFSKGKLIDLGLLPGGTQTYGIGINNLGQIAGFGDVPASGPFATTDDAFLYSHGKLMDIGKQPGWTSSEGLAINDFSQVVGSFTDSNYVIHTFLYKDGKAQDLGSQLYLTLYGPGVFNNFAEIVGLDNLVLGPYEMPVPALYSDGVLQDLNTLVPADTPFYLAYAEAINDSGQIIGGAIGADNSAPTYILTPICDRSKYPISDSDLKKNQHWCLAAKGIKIIPASVSFGNVAVGTTSQSISVTASNTSGKPIRYLGESGINHFNFDAGSCHLQSGSVILASGASCTFSVTFSPVKAGADQGNIQLSTAAGTVSYVLTGTGTD